MRKKYFSFVTLLLAMALTACSAPLQNKQDKISLAAGVNIPGDAYVSDDCKVMLHFATFQPTSADFTILRNKRARTQFICCNKGGNIINSFVVNREIVGHPIVQLDDLTTLGFSDFNLNCTENSVQFVDNSSSLRLKNLTAQGSDLTGYLDKTDTAYYLYNIGVTTADGRYTHTLRFVHEQTSYDVVIPDSLQYVTYDRVRNRFFYRVIALHDDEFQYGFIEYDPASEKYVYKKPEHTISLKDLQDKYGENGTIHGFRILVEDNIAYEILAMSVDETIRKDLNLDSSYVRNSDSREPYWAVLLLHTIDLDKGTSEVQYLTETPFQSDPSYGPLMSGTHLMPTAAVNGSLYFFTNDEKLSVFQPKKGFAQYDIKFQESGVRNPYALFQSDSKGGESLKDRSPIKISPDGSFYVGRAYQDGSIKIYKYDYKNQKFRLYWSSEAGVLSKLDKQYLHFVSFEILD